MGEKKSNENEQFRSSAMLYRKLSQSSRSSSVGSLTSKSVASVDTTTPSSERVTAATSSDQVATGPTLVVLSKQRTEKVNPEVVVDDWLTTTANNLNEKEQQEREDEEEGLKQ